jgi:thioester reductase-like protein
VRALCVNKSASWCDLVYWLPCCSCSRQGVSAYDDGEGNNNFCTIEGKSFFISQDVCQISVSKTITGCFGAKDENGDDFPPAVASRRYCRMEMGDELKLIGRISNIIKLSNGEFISPELIEDIISAPGVAQCMIAASSRCSFVVAVVVPVDLSVCSSTEEQERLYSSMVAAAQQKGLRSHEIPSRVNVKFVGEVWSPENGCLNAAMKLNRSGVMRRYQKDIDEMMAASESNVQDRQPLPSSRMELTVDNLCALLSRRSRSSVCGDDTVDDVRFLGQDSLAIISLLHDIRSTFALPSLSTHHWFSSGTLSRFVSNIKRLIFSNSDDVSETIPAQVLQDDAGLLQDICAPAKPSLGPALCSDAPALLTGVTGFLGVHLLEELLKQSSSRVVFCIVRPGASGAQDAHQRLVSTLAKYKVGLTSSQMSAVRVIAGDVAQVRFGLGLEEYQSLSEKVGSVYHNASEVNWLMTYSQLRASNVIGTLHAIQFAMHGRLKWVHYVSTLNTCDGELLLEKPLASSGYQQSKWVAERLVHQAASRGLNATVCRPGTIGPHSVTGACNVTDYSSCFMLSIAQNGVYLDSNNEFELSPVDCVASAIIAISTSAMRAQGQPHVPVSNDCVSSIGSMSDKTPKSPKCSDPPLISRTLSGQSAGPDASPRALVRRLPSPGSGSTEWQRRHCFNLSHCTPVLSNQAIGCLICQTLQLPPRPVGYETFYRLGSIRMPLRIACISHNTVITLFPPDCACVSRNLRCDRFRTSCRSPISLPRMRCLALCCLSPSCGRTILAKWLLPPSVF